MKSILNKLIYIAIFLFIIVGFSYYVWLGNVNNPAPDNKDTHESHQTVENTVSEDGVCSLDPTGIPDDCSGE